MSDVTLRRLERRLALYDPRLAHVRMRYGLSVLPPGAGIMRRPVPRPGYGDCGYRDGDGYGYGYVYGDDYDGDGDGYSCGYGDGEGDGDGYGYYSTGYGDGSGYGTGYGTGYRDGDGGSRDGWPA